MGHRTRKGLVSLLSESEVTRKWRSLFKDGEVTSETINKAQMLIDQLHPESPLRVRLGTDLDEIRDFMSRRSEREAARTRRPKKKGSREK
jgi:hypothetical protein